MRSAEERLGSCYLSPFPQDGQTDGKPQQLASGSGQLGYGGSVTQDGEFVYPTLSFTESIYEIPTDSRGQKLPLPEGGDYRSPYVSHDGKLMAYGASIEGKARGTSTAMKTGSWMTGAAVDRAAKPRFRQTDRKLFFHVTARAVAGGWHRKRRSAVGFLIPAADGEQASHFAAFLSSDRIVAYPSITKIWWVATSPWLLVRSSV